MQTTTDNTGSSVMTLPYMPFPLMRLPGELRSKIHREYFNSVSTQATENSNNDINDITDIDDSNKSLHTFQPCLNILHANREVRSEAASIFYEEYVNKPSGQPSSLSVPEDLTFQ